MQLRCSHQGHPAVPNLPRPRPTSQNGDRPTIAHHRAVALEDVGACHVTVVVGLDGRRPAQMQNKSSMLTQGVSFFASQPTSDH
jgi:hypothetical protein